MDRRLTHHGASAPHLWLRRKASLCQHSGDYPETCQGTKILRISPPALRGRVMRRLCGALPPRTKTAANATVADTTRTAQRHQEPGLRFPVVSTKERRSSCLSTFPVGLVGSPEANEMLRGHLYPAMSSLTCARSSS